MAAGIDRSAEMIALGNERRKSLSPQVGEHLDLKVMQFDALPNTSHDLTRIAEPEHQVNRNIVEASAVHNNCRGSGDEESPSSTTEIHSVRYLFLPEVALIADRSSLLKSWKPVNGPPAKACMNTAGRDMLRHGFLLEFESLTLM